MSATVLLNLLNELVKSDQNARLVEHFIAFSQQIIKFNNTGDQMLDYVII